ncbi:MAG: efflux RND transporter periplasmic adaptor subunit [Rhodospirillaceae bacterium]|nr:efflux RND transporter periplasmic adaptor subunit [Rhodospirillaceae bacterium]
MNTVSTDSAGRKKYLIAGAVIALGLVAAGVVVASRGAKPPAVAAKAAPALTVTAASPHRANWPTTLEVPGAIAPWQEAIVSAQISGYQITEVLVNVGDQVKKGQVLARINQALLRADEALAVANYEQADANHKRAIALKTNGFISDQNILQLETQVKTTKALLDAKRLQIRYTDVVAPDDGAVSARNATVGSVANTGQELFRLVRQNRLEWRGELSAKQIAAIQPGQAVQLALPSGARAAATVRQVSPTLNTDSRLGLVYADIEADSDARAGMYAVGRIAIGEAPALVVPAEAVVLRDGRSYVLEITDGADGAAKVVLRAVEVGRREAQEVEIVSGITDGVRLAVRGSGFLNDGDGVRVVEPVISKGSLH